MRMQGGWRREEKRPSNVALGERVPRVPLGGRFQVNLVHRSTAASPVNSTRRRATRQHRGSTA